MRNVAFILLRQLRAPLIVLIVVYSVAVLGFVLIPGVDDHGQAWHMDFFHAFYFVSILGTTIGLGEVPYAFTDSQRMWTLVSIYSTVFAWLYAIGSLLAVIQNQAFRSLLSENAFRRAVRRIMEPYYLVCGYGDTGSFLVRALAEAGIRSVVIDIDNDRINALHLEDLRFPVPGLCADAAMPDALRAAGLNHPHCAGVVALTNVDQVNLKVVISAKLLNPRLATIARAETHDAEANIASFGTDHVINPFDTFAGRLALALESPGMYLLYDWMTGVPHEHLSEPVFPSVGRWVLCGYGRFGKAVCERLADARVRTTIVEANPEGTHAPPDTITGRGTEAVTLREAEIEQAVGIVAGTDDDANNLSIVLTARELNPNLFIVARQNQRENNPIFRAASINIIMQRGSIIAHKIFALITTPLLSEFLEAARKMDNEWANQMVSRISGITADEAPRAWAVTIDEEGAPAVRAAIDKGDPVNLEELYRDPRNRDQRLDCFALLIKRDEEHLLAPSESTQVQVGDRILFVGRYGVRAQLDWVVKNENVFHYVYTGRERGSSYLWRVMGSRG